MDENIDIPATEIFRKDSDYKYQISTNRMTD